MKEDEIERLEKIFEGLEDKKNIQSNLFNLYKNKDNPMEETKDLSDLFFKALKKIDSKDLKL